MANPYKNVSKEEFLDKLKEFYKEHGRSPKIKDMGIKNNLPSGTAYYKKFKPLKWNEILELAELPLNHSNVYTEEVAYKTLKDLYDKLGRLPKCEELREYNTRPSYDYYIGQFGTLNEAYCHYGLLEKPLTDQERVEISIQVFKDFAKEYNRYPLIYEYKKIKHKGFKILTLQRKLDLDYLSICRKYIPEYTPEEIEELTKDFVIDEFKRIYNILQRPPKYKELKIYGFNYHFTAIQKCFDGLTYNQIIENLGWIPSGSTTITKTDDEMLNDFESLFKSLGYVPTSFELNTSDNIANYATYLRRFGNIKNVCNLLDIDYETYAILKGVGYKCYDLNGDLCKSKPEMYITNYFINNNIWYEKEPSYSEIIDGLNQRFDWKININNTYYYVEYFGLYSRNNSSKMVREYKVKLHKKIKVLYKNNKISNCIFIFPNDLKNKLLEEIFNK